MAEHAAVRSHASPTLHLMALGWSSLPAALACAEGTGEAQQHRKDQASFTVATSPVFVPGRSQDRIGKDCSCWFAQPM